TGARIKSDLDSVAAGGIILTPYHVPTEPHGHVAERRLGMRNVLGILGILLGLGWVSAARAQSPVVTPLSQPSRFSFLNLFRGSSPPTYPPTVGSSALPPPSSFPRFPDFKPVPFKPINTYTPNYVYTNNRLSR